MKTAIERTTCQKKAILDYLKSTTSHPAAEEIFIEIRKKLPQVSRGTVYRNLSLLKEKGEILEISSKVFHYDRSGASRSFYL